MAVGGLSAASLDAVTIDAYGTLLEVVDPVGSLHALVPEHDRHDVERAFALEVASYREHVGTGGDEEGLARLRARSVAVFNGALGSTLEADEYAGAFRFVPVPGAHEAVLRLRALGLSLAVVANWDLSLHDRLEEAGFAHLFAAVVPAARKPGPHGILRALASLGVEPARALHVGDDEVDERAAAAAGARFAPAPLHDVAAALL